MVMMVMIRRGIFGINGDRVGLPIVGNRRDGESRKHIVDMYGVPT